MDRSRWEIPVNVALYQVSWFACVLGAAHGLEWAGPVVTGVVVMIHLTLTGRAAAELRLIVAAVALGVIVDGTLAATGAVRYPGALSALFVPPPWMLSLWAGFAILLPHALAWLRGRLLLGAALGALGGPLAYLGGARLGAIELPGGALPVFPLATLALAWAAAIPLLLWLSERLVAEEPGRSRGEGTSPSPTPSPDIPV